MATHTHTDTTGATTLLGLPPAAGATVRAEPHCIKAKISSSVFPFVSGTSAETKMKQPKHKTPKKRKAPAAPTINCKSLKPTHTMKELVHPTAVAMALAAPATSTGKISPRMIQGTGPMPTEKPMTYKLKDAKAMEGGAQRPAPCAQ